MTGFFREYVTKRLQRSGKWPGVRRAFKKAHPVCAACGSKRGIQVHHVKPFALHPELELEPDNLISLCPRCHLLWGHLGFFRAFNPTVRQDARIMRLKIMMRELI